MKEVPFKKPVPEVMQIQELIEIGEKFEVPQDRALFYFLYLTGCRITEALQVRVKDLEIVAGPEGQILKVELTTLKNRRHKFRSVPVPFNKEKPMVDYLLRFVRGKDPEARIFPELSRTNAWNRLASEILTSRAVRGKEMIDNFEFKLHPHYLRHCRLTHLVQYYGFDEARLVRFAGWTNSNPAQVYVQLNWMDLAKAMKA